MTQYLNDNGKLVSCGNKLFSTENRAFRYGDGFFETIRCMYGKPLWLKYHYERMIDSAALLSIELPESLRMQGLSHQIEEVLASNDHTDGARVRLSIYRNDGGYYFPTGNEGKYIIESHPLLQSNYILNKEGKIAGIYPNLSKSSNFLAKIKSSNALIYVMAALYAREMKWDDSFLLNESGNIAEATSSNLFIVKDGTLFTPSSDQGCVDGVMKKVIQEHASRAGYEIRESAINPGDLLQANEVFLTNTISGIHWVKGFRDKRYFHKVSEELSLQLAEWAKQQLLE